MHPGGGCVCKIKTGGNADGGRRNGVREDCTEVKGGVLFVKSCYSLRRMTSYCLMSPNLLLHASIPVVSFHLPFVVSKNMIFC